MKKKLANNRVFELTYREEAIESLTEMEELGYRPALIAFINAKGHTQLYVMNADPACFLRRLVDEYGEIHDSFVEGH